MHSLKNVPFLYLNWHWLLDQLVCPITFWFSLYTNTMRIDLRKPTQRAESEWSRAARWRWIQSPLRSPDWRPCPCRLSQSHLAGSDYSPLCLGLQWFFRSPRHILYCANCWANRHNSWCHPILGRLCPVPVILWFFYRICGSFQLNMWSTWICTNSWESGHSFHL